MLLLLPVIILALFLAPAWFGRFVEGRRTRYVVTDRRIFIDSWRRQVEIDLATLNYLEHHRSLFGTSTIHLAPRSPYEAWGAGWWGPWTPALRAVEDGERVYRIISDARGALRR